MRFRSERDLIELLEADIGIAVVPDTSTTSADAEARCGRRARRAPHRAPLRRCGARANRGRIRRDAHAARRGLAAIHRQGVTRLKGVLALFAGAAQRGDQIVDFHALAEIGIDEAGLHQPVAADHEGGGDRQHPAVIAVKTRQILIRQQLLDFGAEPDREIKRQRIAIVEIGQNRERRVGIGLELFGELPASPA